MAKSSFKSNSDRATSELAYYIKCNYDNINLELKDSKFGKSIEISFSNEEKMKIFKSWLHQKLNIDKNGYYCL